MQGFVGVLSNCYNPNHMGNGNPPGPFFTLDRHVLRKMVPVPGLGALVIPAFGFKLFRGCSARMWAPDPNVGPRKMGNPYIGTITTWVSMGKLSPRIPRLNTINTMGTLLRVHPIVPWFLVSMFWIYPAVGQWQMSRFSLAFFIFGDESIEQKVTLQKMYTRIQTPSFLHATCSWYSPESHSASPPAFAHHRCRSDTCLLP